MWEWSGPKIEWRNLWVTRNRFTPSNFKLCPAICLCDGELPDMIKFYRLKKFLVEWLIKTVTFLFSILIEQWPEMTVTINKIYLHETCSIVAMQSRTIPGSPVAMNRSDFFRNRWIHHVVIFKKETGELNICQIKRKRNTVLLYGILNTVWDGTV